MEPPPHRGRFAVLGSGASTAVPWLQCLVGPSCCAVCDECRRNPLASRNVRNNPSALLSVPLPPPAAPAEPPAPPAFAHVMIDAGKTLRASASRWLPELGVRALAALLLTHPHADAYLGLDDLRDLSPRRLLPVYLSAECMAAVRRAFPYLVPAGSVARRDAALGFGVDGEAGAGAAGAGSAPAGGPLFVAQLQWRVFRPWEPFVIPEAGNLVVVPVPVTHGKGAVSMAFEFGGRVLDASAAQGESEGGAGAEGTEAAAVEAAAEAAVAAAAATSQPLLSPAPPLAPPALAPWAGSRILYVSDVSALSRASRAYFRARRTDLLLLDLLNYNSYATHFSALQAVNCALDLGAAGATRFVGMNHAIDHELEHEKLRAFGRSLASAAPDVAVSGAGGGGGGGGGGNALDLGLAHDGLAFEADFALLPGEGEEGGGRGGGLWRLRAELRAVRRAAAAEGSARRMARHAGADASAGAIADGGAFADLEGEGEGGGASDGGEDDAAFSYTLPKRADFALEASPTQVLLGGPAAAAARAAAAAAEAIRLVAEAEAAEARARQAAEAR